MSKIIYITLAGLILFSVLTVLFMAPKYFIGSDEQYYFLFANQVIQSGIKQIPSLIEEYSSDKTAQLYPAPSRVGHILMTSLWLKLFGNNFVSLVRFSSFCFALFLLISFYFSRKYFGKDFAYLYVLLLSCSPLTMALAKRALSDMNLNLFWTISVWLFWDFLSNRKKSRYILFLIVYSISITIKESSIILLVFFILFYFLHKYLFKHNISDLYLLGLILVPFFLVGGTYVFLLGSFHNLISLIRAVLNIHLGFRPANMP